MLAALLCAAIRGFAAEQATPLNAVSCEWPDFPERAQKAEEEGINVLGFLVRADGTVANTMVLNSTGSRHLDRAAVSALSRCVFKRSADETAERWKRVIYTWSFTDDPGLHRAKRATAIAAGKGNLAARYHLSLLLWHTAKTDAERNQAITVLHSSAALGHAHAQYDLGRRFEKGDGVEADLDEALRWYQKAAAQDDPFAKQRLALQKLAED